MVFIGLSTSSLTAQEKTDQELSRWSVGLNLGANYFRVMPAGSGIIDALGWQAPGLFIEYGFSPYFGVNGELRYATFNRSSAASNTIDATLNASVNILNLLTPARSGFWAKWNAFAGFGAGLNRFSYDLSGPGGTGSGISAVFPTTLRVEYPLSDVFALGAEAQYRYYLSEGIGGASTGQLGSDAFMGSVSLRLKLGAKSKTHIQNISVAEYYPAPVPVIIEKVVEKAVISDAELNRFKAIEDKNAKLQTEQTQLKEQLVEVQARSAALGEKSAVNAAELKRIKAVEDQTVVLQAEIAKIQALQAQDAELQKQIDALKATGVARQEVITENTEAIEPGLERLKALEEQSLSLQAQLAELQAKPDVSAELAKIQVLEDKNAQLTAEQGDLKDMIAELKARATTVAEGEEQAALSAVEFKRIRTLEEKNVALEADIAQLQAAIEEVKSMTPPAPVEVKAGMSEDDQKRLKAIEDRSKTLEAMTKALEVKNSALEAKSAALDAKSASLDAKNNALVAEVEKLKAMIEETKESIPVVEVAPVVEKAAEHKCFITEEGSNVKFRFNSLELDPVSFPTLDKITEVLKAKPAMKIVIGGHTDNIGSVDVNNKLSLQRANAVKAYMVSKGAPAASITTVGYGPSKPIVTNDTPEGRAKNRRVEFEVKE